MRRALFRVLAATAAVLATATAMPATAALAADPALRLHFPDVTVAAGPAKINPLFASVDVPAGGLTRIGKFTVTVDTAGVAALADVEVADDIELGDEPTCTRAGAVITCTLAGPDVLDDGTNLLPLLAVQVGAKSGAAQDATGDLTFTVRADDGPVVSAKSSVTIGEGVDLAGVETKPVRAAAGATVPADLRVSNAGEKTAHGVVLAMLGWDPSLRAGAGFSNCTYGLLVVCTFDDELAAGSTYELSTPMRLKIPADAAPGSSATAIGSWYTPSDFKELLDTFPGDTDGVLGPKGTGAAVQLRAVAPKKSRLAAGQVDTDPDNNVLISEVVVSGSRNIDLAAVGATVTGTAGDKVPTRIGFVNNGPGALYPWAFDNNDPSTLVTVPAGLRAVHVDDRCIALPSPVGAEPDNEYLCSSDAVRTPAKTRVLFDFTFQVRDNPAGTPGEVRVDTTADEDSTDSGLPDRDHADDTAKIAVELSGGTGGSLPVTGSDTALLGAGGAGLLLAGALGFLLARRRRTRFTA